jgi:hypothetical protein
MANTTHIRPSGVNVFDENQSLGSNEFDDNVLPQDASLSYSSANHESMALPTALVTVTASSDYDEYEQPNYSSTKKISKTKTSSLTKQLAKPKPSHFTKVIRLYNRNNHEFPKFYKLEFCSAFVTMLI